ncbi:hypothetical protein F4779DRAFT_90831 [Xylariaceae sp. FL0662B]|nr:hypothetical protein F4779DRAFT_90831 [Xylariaceae sp. FL0662B]
MQQKKIYIYIIYVINIRRIYFLPYFHLSSSPQPPITIVGIIIVVTVVIVTYWMDETLLTRLIITMRLLEQCAEGVHTSPLFSFSIGATGLP